MTPAQKRLMFPLQGPRYQTLAFAPIHCWVVAVDAYYRAFFAIIPRGER